MYNDDYAHDVGEDKIFTTEMKNTPKNPFIVGGEQSEEVNATKVEKNPVEISANEEQESQNKTIPADDIGEAYKSALKKDANLDQEDTNPEVTREINSLVESEGISIEGFNRVEKRGSKYIAKQSAKLKAQFDQHDKEAEALITSIDKEISEQKPKLITWTKKGKGKVEKVNKLTKKRHKAELEIEKKGLELERQWLFIESKLYRAILDKYWNYVPVNTATRLARQAHEPWESVVVLEKLIHKVQGKIDENNASQKVI